MFPRYFPYIPIFLSRYFLNNPIFFKIYPCIPYASQIFPIYPVLICPISHIFQDISMYPICFSDISHLSRFDISYIIPYFSKIYPCIPYASQIFPIYPVLIGPIISYMFQDISMYPICFSDISHLSRFDMSYIIPYFSRYIHISHMLPRYFPYIPFWYVL